MCCVERGIIYLFMTRWIFVAVWASAVVVCGLLTAAASLAAGSRAHRLQHLWCTSLVAPGLVPSSQTRGRTHVPCTSRRIPIHWTTKEAQIASVVAILHLFSPYNCPLK